MVGQVNVQHQGKVMYEVPNGTCPMVLYHRYNIATAEKKEE